jgi:hypothetical protein
MLGAGTKLGPYEIVAPLGAVGMSEVHKERACPATVPTNSADSIENS